jgi:hypothetical protein
MSSNLTFYHLAPILLAPGSQIMPGNWGRIKRMQRNLEGNIFREYVFEDVRKRDFPSKPSRLDCVFGFTDVNTARAFRENTRSFEASVLYLVSTEADSSSIHYADYRFPALNGGALDGIEELARKYWTETPQQCIEVVIPGPVTVLEVDT